MDYNGNTEISKKDIDICHPLPSNRKDNKRVVICRFISRNTKAMIIQAKRANRAYKYRDNEFFINNYMSSENKRLFELARSKKKELNLIFVDEKWICSLASK